MAYGIDGLLREVTQLAQVSPPLIVLVGGEVCLTATLAQIQAATRAPLLSLSRELGNHLLERPPDERPRHAASIFRSFVRSYAPQMVLLDRTALLFLPELCLNPLRLLIETSRSVLPLVVAWVGDWDGIALTYATPTHPEYHRTVRPQVRIIPIAQEEQCVTRT